jgi:uncharacterized protein DUF5667/putative zinc finger protein
MLSHATARDWLIPYADGMLAADERRRIDGHVAGCPACRAELREVRELNLLLVTLPPAPVTSVAPFWLKLQAVLPQRRPLRIRNLMGYRRLGLAFAAASIAVLAAAATAFAAPSALPDNPIYPVKLIEEDVHLALTPVNDRVSVQLQRAGERLREAQAMAANHKPRLAESSLRAYTIILDDAAVSLKSPATPQATRDALHTLRAKLGAVERENANRDDGVAAISQLVAAAVDELDRIEQQESAIAPTLTVGEQATPDPTPVVTSQPTPRATPTDDGDHHEHRD